MAKPITKPVVNVLMVCLGNICRSPTAEAVFCQKVSEQGLSDRIHVDSAGTAAYHVGQSPDQRSMEEAKLRGYDLSAQRARAVVIDDFEKFDYLLAMDEQNLINLQQVCPSRFQSKLALFLSYGEQGQREVPDPYYTGRGGFKVVLDLVESASTGLLASIMGNDLNMTRE